MNKKILFGSVLAAFLIVSIPFVSVAQEQQANETQTTELMTMEALIRNLQDLHDGCKEHFADDFEDGFLEEFQNQIYILSENPVLDYCDKLWLISSSLFEIGMALALRHTPIAIALAALCGFLYCAVYACAWLIHNCEWVEGLETQSCGCKSDISITIDADQINTGLNR